MAPGTSPRRRAEARSIRSFGAASGALGTVQTHSSRGSHHLPPRHPQVRQREQRDDLRGVLRKPSVAHTLTQPNCLLSTRNGCSTLARMPALHASSLNASKCGAMNGLSLRRSLGRIATCHRGPPAAVALVHALVAGISEGDLFVAVQQTPGPVSYTHLTLPTIYSV